MRTQNTKLPSITNTKSIFSPLNLNSVLKTYQFIHFPECSAASYTDPKMVSTIGKLTFRVRRNDPLFTFCCSEIHSCLTLVLYLLWKKNLTADARSTMQTVEQSFIQRLNREIGKASSLECNIALMKFQHMSTV